MSLCKSTPSPRPSDRCHCLLLFITTQLPVARTLEFALSWFQVLRIFRAALERPVEADGGLRRSIQQFISVAIVPSVSLVACNPALVEEVWLVLGHFPYEDRYRMYAYWKVCPCLAEPGLPSN